MGSVLLCFSYVVVFVCIILLFCCEGDVCVVSCAHPLAVITSRFCV